MNAYRWYDLVALIRDQLATWGGSDKEEETQEGLGDYP